MLLTNAGCELVKLLADPTRYLDSRLYYYVLGTNGETPTIADGSLGAQIYRKKIKSIRVDDSKLYARCEARRTEANSSVLPIQEYGVKTANGTLVIRDTHAQILKNATNRLFFIFPIDFTIPEIQDVAEGDVLPDGESLVVYTTSSESVYIDLFEEIFPEYTGLLVVTQVNGDQTAVGEVSVLASGASLRITENGVLTLDTSTGYTAVTSGNVYTESIRLGVMQAGYEVAVQVEIHVTKQGGGVVSPSIYRYTAAIKPGETALGNVFTQTALTEFPSAQVSSVRGEASNVGHGVEGSTGGVFILESNGAFSFSSRDDFGLLPTGSSQVSLMPFTIQHSNGTQQAEIQITVVNIAEADSGESLMFVRPEPVTVLVPHDEATVLNLFSYFTSGDISQLEVTAVSGESSRVGVPQQSYLNQGGTWNITAAGSVTFNPGTHFLYLSALNRIVVGSPIITVSNGSQTLDVSLGVTVNGEGEGYSLVNPAYFTCDGVTPVSGNVLVNCENPDNSPISVVGVINSTNGDVQDSARLYVGVPVEAESSYAYSKGWFVVQSNGDFVFTPGDTFASVAAGTVVTNYVYIYVRNEGFSDQRTTVTVTVTKM